MGIYDIAIIGAGVVGSSLARELSKYQLNIILIDKEGDAAEGISKANSGVIHAGFNVQNGTLKAKLNKEGLALLVKLSDELGVKYKICKKLVVAKNDAEKKHLEKLLEQGRKNSTPNLSIIGEGVIKKLEPNIKNAKWALLSGSTGIITPYQLTIALAENACLNGVKVLLNTQVSGIKKNTDNIFIVFDNKRKIICHSRWVINCAGLYAVNIANMLEKLPFEIRPCRGEYYILDKNAEESLKMAVYPVPLEDGRSLGVHLTPTLNGNILIGPSAEFIESIDDLANIREVMENLKREAFELMPSLKRYTFIKNYSGLRPKLFDIKNRKFVNDFYIAESTLNSRFVNLLGIESPGLTAAPAIANYLIEKIILQKEKLIRKDIFYPKWEGVIRSSMLPLNELKTLIKDDSDYGELICRCEQISRGEILQAVNNLLGAKTLNAIKKRTHSMMGRCQGGFCISRIARILIDDFNFSPEEILKNTQGSNMFLKKELRCKS